MNYRAYPDLYPETETPHPEHSEHPEHPEHPGTTTAAACPTTLEDLLAQVQEKRAAKVKAQEEIEAAARRTEAVENLHEMVNAAISTTMQQALRMEVTIPNSGETPLVTFTVDGQKWNLYQRDGGSRWVLYPPDHTDYAAIELYRGSVEEHLLLAIVEWRERGGPVLTKTATAPRLLQEQTGRYDAYRLYELSASSGCGSLDQYEQVVARIGADGDVDVAMLSGRDDEEAGGTVRHTIPAATMAALVPLYTSYMAEIAAQKVQTAAQQEDDPPF